MYYHRHQPDDVHCRKASVVDSSIASTLRHAKPEPSAVYTSSQRSTMAAWRRRRGQNFCGIARESGISSLGFKIEGVGRAQCHRSGWRSAFCGFALEPTSSCLDQTTLCTNRARRCHGLAATAGSSSRDLQTAVSATDTFHEAFQGHPAVGAKRNSVRTSLFLLCSVNFSRQSTNFRATVCPRGQSYCSIASLRYKKKKKRSGNWPIYYVPLWYSTQCSVAKSISSLF